MEIKIPNIAESITEVVIAEWLKKDGDSVKIDEAICTVETDKASQEIYADVAGVLKIVVQAGETIPVGTTIAKIEGGNATPTTKTENIVTQTAPAKVETPAKAEPTAKTGKIVEMVVTPIAESITEVVIGSWLKQEGDFVNLDEPLCEVETDKATQEMPATATGILRIVAKAGTTLKIGDLICRIEETNAPAKATTSTQVVSQPTAQVVHSSQKDSYASGTPSPAAAKILDEKGINSSEVKGTGIDGRITKNDATLAEKTIAKPTQMESPKTETIEIATGERTQRRVRMTQMRKTIAKRLVAVKNETAMLTTFNEVNMKPIMDLRAKYKDEFKEKHNVGLGFMSFFAKAAANALLQIPEVNAYIDNGEIVYNDFVDISVAVSAPKGLVVPVLRNVETMNFAQIEKGIVNLATKAKNNTLSIDDMSGGTFTITNGGIFGSMLSTPIINAPQSAILGMHNIVERPMAVNGQVQILPIMYVALSYDHRIIDGREAVTFLVAIKKYLENPERLLLNL